MQEKVFFKNSRGQKLCGILYTPSNFKYTVVFVNGIGTLIGDWESSDIKPFTDANYRVFLFDYYGRGKSGGKWEDTNMTTALDDLKSALDFLKTDRIALIGESFGGNIILNFDFKDKRIKVIALLYAGYDMLKWQKGRRFREAQRQGFSPSRTYPDRRYPLSFFEDCKKYNTFSNISKIKVPILITHGDNDNYISVEDAKTAYRVANEPKKLFILKGEKHSYSEIGFKKAYKEIINWFEKYLK